MRSNVNTRAEGALLVQRLPARLRCDPGTGRPYLTRVELPAWQGIGLPRQCDNPDREPDPWPGA